VISGLYRDKEFLPVFVRYDVEAPIGPPKVGASVSVLGEAFAHDSFAKSTEFTLSTIFHNTLLLLSCGILSAMDSAKEILPQHCGNSFLESQALYLESQSIVVAENAQSFFEDLADGQSSDVVRQDQQLFLGRNPAIGLN
jgi:hypothetical protein